MEEISSKAAHSTMYFIYHTFLYVLFYKPLNQAEDVLTIEL
jgi:hypothetical protein